MVILDVTGAIAVLYLFFSTIYPEGQSRDRWIGSILSVCLSLVTLMIIVSVLRADSLDDDGTSSSRASRSNMFSIFRN